MEHQTGPDGPDGRDGTEEAERAAATQPGAPESVLGTDGEANHRGSGPDAGSGPGADDAGSSLGVDDAATAGEESVPGAGESGPMTAQPRSGPERAAEPRPATGEPRVDAALRLLDRLPNLPVSEHAELYEDVHGQLSDVLGELDSGSAGPAPD